MDTPELWISLCSDTEDNHPTYVPGWSEQGSIYDTNPAIIRYEWTRYWRDLSEFFQRLKIPITWLLRVDDGPIYDTMLRRFKRKIFDLKSCGDEIGIHIHTFFFDEDSKIWRQTRDSEHEANIVRRSITYFRRILGFTPCSVRMGWNAMSNKIMEILDKEGLIVDASGIPGNYCEGKFSKRDNFYDWRIAPRDPYHPSYQNYQVPGKRRILEMPISTSPGTNMMLTSFVNNLSSLKISHTLYRLVPFTTRFYVAPNPYFYISPWWSTTNVDKIIEAHVKKAKKEGIAFLAGFFHSCDILSPTSRKNIYFLRNMNKVIDKILEIEGVRLRFSTLAQTVSKYNESYDDMSSWNDNSDRKS